MNTKEQAEREYRAQWIRDAARDFCLARESVCPPTLFPTIDLAADREVTVRHYHSLASSLWDRYVEERDK